MRLVFVLALLASVVLAHHNHLVHVDGALTDAQLADLQRDGSVHVLSSYTSTRLGRTVLTVDSSGLRRRADSTDGTGEPESDAIVVGRLAQHLYSTLSAQSTAYLIEEDVILDTAAATASWGLDRVDQRDRPLDGQYSPPASGSNIHVYVVDTGIQIGHAEFGGRASQDFTVFGSHTDCDGHGTHVAGIVGSASWGVAKQARLHAVRVLDCSGSGTVSGVVQGLMWVYDNHVRPTVVNLSLGLYANVYSLQQILDDLRSLGILVVAAAGNEDRNGCDHYPSAYASVLSVGATNAADQRAWFSNWGQCVDLMAPGEQIKSTYPTDTTATLSGTSMASPCVAGAAALALQQAPTLTAVQMEQHLLATATQGRLSSLSTAPNTLLYVGNQQEQTPSPSPPADPSNSASPTQPPSASRTRSQSRTPSHSPIPGANSAPPARSASCWLLLTATLIMAALY